MAVAYLWPVLVQASQLQPQYSQGGSSLSTLGLARSTAGTKKGAAAWGEIRASRSREVARPSNNPCTPVLDARPRETTVAPTYQQPVRSSGSGDRGGHQVIIHTHITFSFPPDSVSRVIPVGSRQ